MKELCILAVAGEWRQACSIDLERGRNLAVGGNKFEVLRGRFCGALVEAGNDSKRCPKTQLMAQAFTGF